MGVTFMTMRDRILYPFSEADRLAGVTPGTSKRWLRGYRSSGATFYDLIEVVIVGKLGEQGLSFTTIRRIVDLCQKALGVPRPLTTSAFKTEWHCVLAKVNGVPIAWNDIFESFLENVDYRDDRVATWWPQGRAAGIRIDPEWGWGWPVVSSRGVRTDILLEHWEAGESVADIAEDYELTLLEVQAALRFELSRPNKARQLRRIPNLL